MNSIAGHIRKHSTLSFFIISAILLSIAGPSPTGADNKETIPNRVVAVIPSDAPPNYFMDAKTGKPAGFAVDVMDKIAERAGLQVDYIFAHSWAEVISRVKRGEADIIPVMSISEERQQYLAFTSPITTVPLSFFVRSHTGLIDVTAGSHTVGVILGSVAHERLSGNTNLRLTAYESFQQGLFDLLAGKVDAFACPAPIFLYLARESGVEDKIKIAGGPIAELKMAIAVRKDNARLQARLNTAIEGFVGRPDYQRIYTKWFGRPTPYWTTSRILSICGFLIFFLVAGMLVFRYITILRFNRRLLAEIEGRRRAEDELRKAHDELEQRVEERTFQLGNANEELEHEIAERIKAEATIKEKNLMLQTLIHAMPDQVFFKDSGGRFLLGNKTMEEAIGLRQEEFVGKTDDEISSPDVAEACKRSDAEAIKSGRPTRSEEGYTDNSGELKFLDVVKAPIYDGRGELMGLVGVSRDITDRKKMEEALRRSEEKFRTLFDSAVDGLFIIDMNGNFIDANRTAHERLGYSKQELLSMHISQLDHPDFRNRISERVESLKRNGRCVFESAHLRKDGTSMPVEVSSRSMDFEDHTVFFSVIRDITERKQAEEALRESESRYHVLFDQSPDGILLIDVEGKVLEFNEMAHRQLGYSREEFAELSLADIDPVESPKEIRGKIGNILAAGRAEFDVKHRTKQGEVRDVHIITQVIMLSDRPVLHAIWHDATERKKAEEDVVRSEKRFHALFDNTPLGIALVGPDRRFLDCNPAFRHMLGYGLEELRGMSVPEISHPEDNLLTQRYYREMLEGKMDSFTVEKRYMRKDGTVFWTNLTGAIMRTEKNDPVVFFGIIEDITERKAADDKIKASLKEKEVLLREIHHRVKNNLNVIISLLRLQSNHITEPAMLGIFEDCQNRIRSMALIHEKLYQTKDFTRVNYKEYIFSLLSDLSASYVHYKNRPKIVRDIQDVFLDLDTAIPCGLIINELVTNALKYAFPDNRTGEVVVSLVAENNTYILSVRDNGIGLPEDFDLNKSKTLGLQLVNILVKQLGGTIGTRVKAGTEFRITFSGRTTEPKNRK